jgi:CHAD domain-containing protein
MLVKTQIQANLRKLRKSLKRAPRRLTPEDVHKLRTRARRVVSLSDSHSLPALNKANLAEPIKRIRKRAGRVRDMDVLTAHLAAMHSDEDPSCRTQLLEYLGAKRYRRADRLVQLLQDQGRWLRKELRRVAKGVAKDTSRKSGKSARRARSKQSAQVLELTAGLSEPVHLNKSNLHPYRLTVKELRDALSMAGGTRDSRFAGMLGQCQDAIGEWHDWEELIAIAEKTLDHSPQCPLLHKLKTISKQKFDSALTIAEKLRTDYARPDASRTKIGGEKHGKAKTSKAHSRGAKSGRAKTTQASSSPPPIPERALKAVAGVVR